MARSKRLYILDIDDVGMWLAEYAADIADTFDAYVELGMSPLDIDIHGFASKLGERFATHPTKALTIIAAYGWDDALVGGCGFYESPWWRFESDACEMAMKAIKAKHGIEF